MQVSFNTKKESNRKQEEAFLKLTPSERFLTFLRLSKQSLKLFPAKEKVGNLIIQIEPKNG